MDFGTAGSGADYNAMTEFLKSVFPNYRDGMYEGNLPAGKGHERVEGGWFDRWATRWGGGESFDGILSYAWFSPTTKITIFIDDDMLTISDMRHAGKPDIWEYTNRAGQRVSIRWSIAQAHYHQLEPERIEAILNTKIPDCRFWDMVNARARELYEKG